MVFRPIRCRFLTNLQAVPFKSVHLHQHNEALRVEYVSFLKNTALWATRPVMNSSLCPTQMAC
jgi:hypothetical protein